MLFVLLELGPGFTLVGLTGRQKSLLCTDGVNCGMEDVAWHLHLTRSCSTHSAIDTDAFDSCSTRIC
jgi:hypothetical protein